MGTIKSSKVFRKISGDPAPTLRADYNAQADALDDEIDEAVASVGSLPGSDNWEGRKRFVVDEGRQYTYTTADGWVPSMPGAPFDPEYAYTNTSNTITADAFAALPTAAVSKTIAVEYDCWAEIRLTTRGVVTASGQMDIGVAVSGATTLAANEIATGVTPTGVYAVVISTTNVQNSMSKVVQLNAGNNTFTVQARDAGTGGTKVLIDALLQIIPIGAA